MLKNLVICLSIVTTVLCDCSGPPPIALPITGVQLPSGHSMRGIAASIGSPPQNFSFMAQNYLNDTWVYNTTALFCINGTTAEQCLTQRGGAYDPSKSSTARAGLDVYAAGGSPSDTFRAENEHIWASSWAIDDITMGNKTLKNYPVGMPGFDMGGRYDTQNNIGLGLNSSFLTAMKDAGHIASRSYAYWWGIDNPASTEAMDGQIVFGGYDAAKVMGKNVTQKLLPWSPGCPSGMFVTLSSLSLGFPNGTESEILAPTAMSGCLQLDFPTVMTLDIDPWFGKFQDITQTADWNNSLGMYWYAPTYASNDIYQGELVMSLTSGLSITVPNDVLTSPDTYVSPSGAVETNSSASVLLIDVNTGVNEEGTTLIGTQFFSSAYLFVDLDAGTFTMWQANATTESRLVAVGGDCSRSPTVNGEETPKPIPPPSSTPTNTTSTNNTTGDSSASDHSALSTGSIVAIAIGSVSAITLAVVAVIYISRKRRSRKPFSQIKSHPLPELDDDTKHTKPKAYEVDGNGMATEMWASRDPYELSSFSHPVEMEAGGQPFELSAVQTPKTASRY